MNIHVCPRCKFAVVAGRKLCEKCAAAVKAEREEKRKRKREERNG